MNQKKSVLVEIFLKKALEFIKAELNLLKILIRKTEVVAVKNGVVKQSDERLKWTGSIAELVELIYGLVEVGKINNGNIEISEMADFFCTGFNFKIKDCYNSYHHITKRNNDSRTYFLDLMASKLNEKIDGSDK